MGRTACWLGRCCFSIRRGVTSEDKSELQSIHFDADKFTVEQAKAWLKEHDYKPILFEPASAQAAADEFVIIEAASGEEGQSRFRVMGVAYSGGKMKLPGWRYLVVVDLPDDPMFLGPLAKVFDHLVVCSCKII